MGPGAPQEDVIGTASVEILPKFDAIDAALTKLEERLAALVEKEWKVSVAVEGDAPARSASKVQNEPVKTAGGHVVGPQGTTTSGRKTSIDVELDYDSIGEGVRDAIEASTRANKLRLEIDLGYIQEQLNRLTLHVGVAPGAPGTSPGMPSGANISTGLNTVAQSFIEKTRQGGAITSDEVKQVVELLTGRRLPDRGPEPTDRTRAGAYVAQQVHDIVQTVLPGSTDVSSRAVADRLRELASQRTDLADVEKIVVAGQLSQIEEVYSGVIKAVGQEMSAFTAAPLPPVQGPPPTSGPIATEFRATVRSREQQLREAIKDAGEAEQERVDRQLANALKKAVIFESPEERLKRIYAAPWGPRTIWADEPQDPGQRSRRTPPEAIQPIVTETEPRSREDLVANISRQRMIENILQDELERRAERTAQGPRPHRQAHPTGGLTSIPSLQDLRAGLRRQAAMEVASDFELKDQARQSEWRDSQRGFPIVGERYMRGGTDIGARAADFIPERTYRGLSSEERRALKREFTRRVDTRADQLARETQARMRQSREEARTFTDESGVVRQRPDPNVILPARQGDTRSRARRRTETSLIEPEPVSGAKDRTMVGPMVVRGVNLEPLARSVARGEFLGLGLNPRGEMGRLPLDAEGNPIIRKGFVSLVNRISGETESVEALSQSQALQRHLKLLFEVGAGGEGERDLMIAALLKRQKPNTTVPLADEEIGILAPFMREATRVTHPELDPGHTTAASGKWYVADPGAVDRFVKERAKDARLTFEQAAMAHEQERASASLNRQRREEGAYGDVGEGFHVPYRMEGGHAAPTEMPIAEWRKVIKSRDVLDRAGITSDDLDEIADVARMMRGGILPGVVTESLGPTSPYQPGLPLARASRTYGQGGVMEQGSAVEYEMVRRLGRPGGILDKLSNLGLTAGRRPESLAAIKEFFKGQRELEVIFASVNAAIDEYNAIRTQETQAQHVGQGIDSRTGKPRASEVVRPVTLPSETRLQQIAAERDVLPWTDPKQVDAAGKPIKLRASRDQSVENRIALEADFRARASTFEEEGMRVFMRVMSGVSTGLDKQGLAQARQERIDEMLAGKHGRPAARFAREYQEREPAFRKDLTEKYQASSALLDKEEQHLKEVVKLTREYMGGFSERARAAGLGGRPRAEVSAFLAEDFEANRPMRTIPTKEGVRAAPMGKELAGAVRAEVQSLLENKRISLASLGITKPTIVGEARILETGTQSAERAAQFASTQSPLEPGETREARQARLEADRLMREQNPTFYPPDEDALKRGEDLAAGAHIMEDILARNAAAGDGGGGGLIHVWVDGPFPLAVSGGGGSGGDGGGRKVKKGKEPKEDPTATQGQARTIFGPPREDTIPQKPREEMAQAVRRATAAVLFAGPQGVDKSLYGAMYGNTPLGAREPYTPPVGKFQGARGRWMRKQAAMPIAMLPDQRPEEMLLLPEWTATTMAKREAAAAAAKRWQAATSRPYAKRVSRAELATLLRTTTGETLRDVEPAEDRFANEDVNLAALREINRAIVSAQKAEPARALSTMGVVLGQRFIGRPDRPGGPEERRLMARQEEAQFRVTLREQIAAQDAARQAASDLAAAQKALSASPEGSASQKRARIAVEDYTRAHAEALVALRKATDANDEQRAVALKAGEAAGTVGDAFRNLATGFAGGIAGGLISGVAMQLVGAISGAVGGAIQATIPTIDTMLGSGLTAQRVNRQLADVAGQSGLSGTAVRQSIAAAGIGPSDLSRLSSLVPAAQQLAANDMLNRQLEFERTNKANREQAFEMGLPPGVSPSLFRGQGAALSIEVDPGLLRDVLGIGSIDLGGADSTAKVVAGIIRETRGAGLTERLESAGLTSRIERGDVGDSAEIFQKIGFQAIDLLKALQDEGLKITDIEDAGDLVRVVEALSPDRIDPATMAQIQFDSAEFQNMIFRAYQQRDLGLRSTQQQTGLAGAVNLPLPFGTGIPGGVSPGFAAQFSAIERAARAYETSGLRNVRSVLSQAPDFDMGIVDEFETLGERVRDWKVQAADLSAAKAMRQYQQSVLQATYAVEDLRAVTGQGQGSQVGQLERENLLLGRRLQLLQFEQQQRSINFGIATAGFQSVGLTGEERAANLRVARREARLKQEQLDIGRQMFGNQVQIVDEQNLRALQAATFGLREIQRSFRDDRRIAQLGQLVQISERRIGQLGNVIGQYLSTEMGLFEAQQVYAQQIADSSHVALRGANRFKDAAASFKEAVELLLGIDEEGAQKGPGGRSRGGTFQVNINVGAGSNQSLVDDIVRAIQNTASMFGFN